MGIQIVSTSSLTEEQTAFGYDFGDYVNRRRELAHLHQLFDAITSNNTTYIVESFIQQTYVYITGGLLGLYAKPHSLSNYYQTYNMQDIVVLNKVDGTWTTKPTTFELGNINSNLQVGTIDSRDASEPQLDNNTQDVLTFNGPSGRLIPFNYDNYYEGYTILDDETEEQTYYTVFGPYIYQNGAIAKDYSYLVAEGENLPKVVGATKYNGKILAILSINYAGRANPDGTTGGFYEEIYLNTDRITYRRAGRPIEIWRFNSSCTEAKTSTQIITIFPSSELSEWSIEYSTYTSGIGNRTFEVDGTNWHITESSYGNFFQDYNGDTPNSIAIVHNLDHRSNTNFENIAFSSILPVARKGVEIDTRTPYAGTVNTISAGSFTGAYNQIFISGMGYFEATWSVSGSYSGCASPPNATISWGYLLPNEPGSCLPGSVIHTGWVSATITMAGGTTTGLYTSPNVELTDANSAWRLDSNVGGYCTSSPGCSSDLCFPIAAPTCQETAYSPPDIRYATGKIVKNFVCAGTIGCGAGGAGKCCTTCTGGDSGCIGNCYTTDGTFVWCLVSTLSYTRVCI